MNREERMDRQADMDTADTAAERDVRIPVREEKLVAGTQRQEEGRVHLHKDVVEEQQTLNVPTQHEHVRVERAPYSGEAGDTGDAFQGADIDIPVMGERAVPSKQVRGVEEVHLHKDVVTENQPVQGTVRKEFVAVDSDGMDAVDGAAVRDTSGTSSTSGSYATSTQATSGMGGVDSVDGAKDAYQTTKGSFDDSEDRLDGRDGSGEGLGAKIRRGVDRLVHR